MYTPVAEMIVELIDKADKSRVIVHFGREFEWDSVDPPTLDAGQTALLRDAGSIRFSEHYMDEKKAGALLRAMAALQANSHASMELNLSGDKLGDAGVVKVAELLKVNTSIGELALFKVGMGEVGARALVAALQLNTAIAELDLSLNDIGNAGVTHVVDLLKVNTSIKNFIFHMCKWVTWALSTSPRC